MKIKINSRKSIAEIQDEFNTVFPYLKLEFFSKPHLSGSGSPKKYMVPNTKTVGEFKSFHEPQNEILIIPSMTVKMLEESFNTLYGLSVQVFRKSGKIWLETTITDNWTLEEQNTQGEELSKKIA